MTGLPDRVSVQTHRGFQVAERLGHVDAVALRGHHQHGVAPVVADEEVGEGVALHGREDHLLGGQGQHAGGERLAGEGVGVGHGRTDLADAVHSGDLVPQQGDGDDAFLGVEGERRRAPRPGR